MKKITNILFIFFIWLIANSPLLSTSIAGGQCHALLLDENGIVWSFGKGDYGKLGYRCRENKPVPTPIEGIPPIAIPKIRRFNTTKNARNQHFCEP